MKIEEHVSLRDFSPFKTGGTAEYFCRVTENSELLEAIRFAAARSIRWRIIGQATKSLLSDSGFNGLIIRDETKSIIFLHERSQVIVDAGTPIGALLARVVSEGYSGLEFLVGELGTIGGAIVNNWNRGDRKISDLVRSVTLLTVGEDDQPKAVTVDRDWFEFATHSSKIKRLGANQELTPAILTVTLQLAKTSSETALRYWRLYESQLPAKPPASSVAIKAFDCLTTKAETPSHSVDVECLPIKVRPEQIKHWNLERLAVFAANPNYLINKKLATSRETAELIEKIEQSFDTDFPPRTHLDFIGLWS